MTTNSFLLVGSYVVPLVAIVVFTVLYFIRYKRYLIDKNSYATEQYMRLKLLKYVPEVIRNSKTLQGYSERKVFELNRSNHRNEWKLTDAIFYEFIAILEKRIRIRVVIKKAGTAPLYFWSVIPFWKKGKEGNRNTMHYGNPEED